MYRFKVCELKTGDVLDEVPFTIDGDLTRVLQGHGAGKLGLPIFDEKCPENWEQLVLPGRSLILVVDEDDRIVWPGIPTTRLREGTGIVGFPCMTVEGYLLHRYVPTLAYSQRDQALIAKDLASLAGDAAGIPLQYDCPLTGVLHDRTYADDENARVYNRLQELAAVENGFNWTIDVDWADDTHKRVKYTFRTGYPHLGYRTDAPEHVFEMPGNIKDYDYAEQWGEADAATHVRAVGDGDADSKAMSDPIIDTMREAAGWPRMEFRGQFSGVTERDTINDHGKALAAQLFGGQNVITLTTKEDKGTSLGDLTLGDSAKVRISTKELVLDEVLVVVGWSLAASSAEFKPTLARLGVA